MHTSMLADDAWELYNQPGHKHGVAISSMPESDELTAVCEMPRVWALIRRDAERGFVGTHYPHAHLSAKVTELILAELERCWFDAELVCDNTFKTPQIKIGWYRPRCE